MITCDRCKHYKVYGGYDYCYVPKNMRINYRGISIPNLDPRNKNANCDCEDFEQKERNIILKIYDMGLKRIKWQSQR